VKIVGEQAYAGAKSAEATVFGVLALGKDENAVAAIDGLSSVSEALAKSGFTRQRKEVEQCNGERPPHAIVAPGEKHLAGGGRAQLFQRFTGSCGCDFPAEPGW